MDLLLSHFDIFLPVCDYSQSLGTGTHTARGRQFIVCGFLSPVFNKQYSMFEAAGPTGLACVNAHKHTLKNNSSAFFFF